MNGRLARPGFSLIEALVVLAISGMALAIIFSIGTKAGDSGFALGRKAMVAADQDIAVGDLRSLIRSIVIRPPETANDTDLPATGTAARLEVDVVMERATQCAPQGWSGRLVLEVQRRGPGSVLTCAAGGRPAVDLVPAVNGAVSAFSYSIDRQLWSNAYTSSGELPRTPEGGLVSQSVWVRYTAEPGRDVVEMTSTGRPDIWYRFDAQF